ncbi:MAG: glycoside hydrolase family 3 C-terminal domain-containing protein [Solirubrobacterales bacterium]|nr:glycoside hydrolase family 3 C-terminal domain-containing protein [Solirubrobacterales bacterium]
MRLRSLLPASILAVLIAVPIADSSARQRRSGDPTPIYLNRSYSPAERAADLVARMTLTQKASQMNSSQAPAIPASPSIPTGVSAYGWWNEALHGVSRLQLAPSGNSTVLQNTTSYPISLALGSSWDPNIMYQEASAISDEAREVVPNNSLDLDFYSPTVNLGRDPRWGRNDEAFSEDPLLTGDMGSQFVDGLEGKDQQGNLLPQGGGYLKAIATIKHYAANNTEGDRIGGPTDRLTGTSNMDERTLREYYTAQFKQIIQQSHPGSIMSAYNSVNDIPSPANIHLIDTLARQTFGFGGYFTSDCDAVYEIYHGHHWQPPGYSRPLNVTEARAFADAAGEDLNCNAGYADNFSYGNTLPAAAHEAIPTQTDIFNSGDMDTSLVRLFAARMQLGEFDDVANEPWVKAARAQLPPGTWTNSDANNAVTETPARLQLARQVGDRGFVLLKNSNTTLGNGATGTVLPIHVPRSGPFKVAVIGYLANPTPRGEVGSTGAAAGAMYLGGYSSDQGAPGMAKEATPYQGLKQAIQAINPNATVDFYNGFTGSPTNASQLTTIDQSAVNAAANYDNVIVYAGTDDSTANEFVDRTDMALPGAQAQLINEVAAKNPNTAAVIEAIGQVDVDSFRDNVPSLLWTSYYGQRKGDALADVVLGNYNPSGHLPFTWYENASDLPALDDYSIRPSATSMGRTYMYYRGPESFPFGYGLSYTTFRTSNLRVDRSNLGANDTFRVAVDVTNTGSVAGKDLVQLYISTPDAPASMELPIKRLEGFQQVELDPGQAKTVTLTVSVPKLAFFNQSANRYEVYDGRYGVEIASSAADGDILARRDVTVRGALTPLPSVLTAKPTMLGDAQRGIQSRVMYPENAAVIAHLTVSMNDESLYGFIEPGQSKPFPAGMRFTFASDHPGVVAVEPGNTIRTLRNGVATITARVTYRGVTRSTQFVVRVLSELDRLSIDGRRIRGFQPDGLSYDSIVPDGAPTPRVTAHTPDPSATVTVTQASGVPGHATVTVTGPDGITQTYTVYFARRARSDEFSGTSVGPQWTWIRQDPAAEQVSGGALTITPEQGDLGGTNPPARNILLQPALGNWAMVSKLTFSTAPHVANQQGGLIAYQDDANWLKIDWEYSNGTAELAETTSDNQNVSGTQTTQVLTTIPTAGLLSANTVWLAMQKIGARYITYYSTDGVHFTPIYNVGASLSNVKVGLFAWNGPATNSDLKVSFQHFRILNGGPGFARAG